MAQKVRLIVSPCRTGRENMRTDLDLFQAYIKDPSLPILRLYSWKPKCVSFGYSQKIEPFPGWDTVKRPTGGGMVFHNEDEITYSLISSYAALGIAPNLRESYRIISKALALAFEELGITVDFAPKKNCQPNPKFCFAYPANFELMFQGKKIVGSAQKKQGTAFLQQGSIFVSMAHQPEELRKSAISIEDILGRKPDFAELSKILASAFSKGLGIALAADFA